MSSYVMSSSEFRNRNSLWDIHTCHSKPVNVIPGSLILGSFLTVYFTQYIWNLNNNIPIRKIKTKRATRVAREPV